MMIELAEDATAIIDALYVNPGNTYDKVWDIIEKIESDPVEAQHAGWTNYVSSQDLYGTKVPGTDYTIFWRVSEDVLDIRLIAADLGL